MAGDVRSLFALLIIAVSVSLCETETGASFRGTEGDGVEPGSNEHHASSRTMHGHFHYDYSRPSRRSDGSSSDYVAAALFGAPASKKETLNNEGFTYQYISRPGDRERDISNIFSQKKTGRPTIEPTAPPTMSPTKQPTKRPTDSPTVIPVVPPTMSPTKQPTKRPTDSPTVIPVVPPTMSPTKQPTKRPTDSPTVIPVVGQVTPQPVSKPALSFDAGDFSMNKKSEDGIVNLSNGLSARPIARAGEYVQLADGEKSEIKFHTLPDGADVFRKPDGGWMYASNSESGSSGSKWDDGGVGVLEFNRRGEVISYYRVANNTKRNCGGGKTPWNSWISCEESKGGQVIQTDPYGIESQRTTAMGDLGYYESFAYDDQTIRPTFYVTRDQKDGVVSRFTPDDDAMQCFLKKNDYDRWCTLESGEIDYLYLKENNGVEWTTDYDIAKQNAKELYPNSEGIDIHNGVLYFTSKEEKRLVIVNLRTRTYSLHSTKSGAFNNQPDQIERVLGSDAELLFLCEDGGTDAGLHGRDATGQYFTILYADKQKIKEEGEKTEETTGLGISPDGMHLYVSFQKIGIIYDVTRDDKRPFNGAMLDIKYHART